MTASVASALSVRQRQILAFIRRYFQANGYAPTLREIAPAVGLEAASAVRYQLLELERMGWVRRHPQRPRALVILNPADGGE